MQLLVAFMTVYELILCVADIFLFSKQCSITHSLLLFMLVLIKVNLITYFVRIFLQGKNLYNTPNLHTTLILSDPLFQLYS